MVVQNVNTPLVQDVLYGIIYSGMHTSLSLMIIIPSHCNTAANLSFAPPNPHAQPCNPIIPFLVTIIMIIIVNSQTK